MSAVPMRSLRIVLLAATIGAIAPPLAADQFTRDRELSWESFREDSRSFFSNVFLGGVDENRDGRIESPRETSNAAIFRSAVLASMLLGLICGLLGSFITMRGMALFGDMIGHAVLPGVAVAVIIVGTKSTFELLIGALAAGLLATALTRAIRTRTRIKEDAALGISLTFFYAIGVWLLAWITRESSLSVESGGLDHYLFGNPAVILPGDLWALAFAAAAVLAAVGAGYKELLVGAFDPGFATSIGFRATRIDLVLLVLLTVVVVVSIKILGVVLVAALLIIPPSAAYLLTDRFRRLCALSVAIACLSGVAGVYLSLVLHVDMGPTIIAIAFAILVSVFAFAPAHGLLSRWIRHRRLALRTLRENLLAAAYRLRERDRGLGSDVPIASIADERREPAQVTSALARRLAGSGWGELRGDVLSLTPLGEEHARRVVRTHRLWELFLAREASLPGDRVHRDAEEVEHLLDDATLDELDALLGAPDEDPHGRGIPARAPSTATEAER